MGCSQAVRHQTLTLAFVGPNPATPANTKGGLSSAFCVGWGGMNTAEHLQSKCFGSHSPRRATPACEAAASERIFAAGEYPVTLACAKRAPVGDLLCWLGWSEYGRAFAKQMLRFAFAAQSDARLRGGGKRANLRRRRIPGHFSLCKKGACGRPFALAGVE